MNSWKARGGLAAIALFAGMAAAITPARAEPVSIATRAVGPMVQVFPSSVPPGEPEAKLEAARGEWEPFQIVVHAAGGALHGVRAEATALRGAGELAAPRLARVEYLDVRTPSSVEGHAGPWPDALVPDVDAYAGEKRRAFPFDVPAGEARAIWVELFVPVSATPGVYGGSVRVSADGRAPATTAIELTVHKFALPTSASLPVTFGFSAGAVAKAHPGLAGDATAKLVEQYEVALLRHRISAHGGSMDPAPWKSAGGKLTIDWAPYDAEVGPFLDGTVDRGGPAEGARWTAFDFRVPQKLQGAERADYARQLAAHLRARGWLGRVFDYTYDEPPEDKLDEVRRRAAELRRAVTDVPRLVTRVLDPKLRGSVDIWCPVVNYLDDKAGNSNSPARAAYDEPLRHGERLWWYQACMSHGCNIVGGSYFTGWPSYAVDAPAMSHRIFEWLTYRYRVGGELYYDTVEAYGAGKDPWKDQLLFGGNGDGTLFYPGRARSLGGTHDFPVESIRLQLIREGLEDYEYLKLYARVAGDKAAQALAATIAGKTYEWEHDAGRLYAARKKMAEAIDRAVASDGGIGVTAR
jgi:hypothetical protein